MSDTYADPGNFMMRAYQALTSMQQSLTDVYVKDGELTQDALDNVNFIMNETRDLLEAKQNAMKDLTGEALSKAQGEYQTLSAKWKDYYTEANSNLNIPQDSAQRSSSNMNNFQQFLSQLFGIMQNLSQALASGS
jgi:hypothetical protein